MPRLKTFLTVIGAVTILVLAANSAVYAATGGKFILGKSNTAGKTTSLVNKKGTALSLSSKAGTPSLKVNRTTKVANLNSDLLDGLDQSKFALAAGATNTIIADGEALDLDGDLVGDVIAAFATCPAGTRLTGGGGDDYTGDGLPFINSPLDKTTWMVASTADVTLDDPADVVAYVQCYNPRGAVSGAYRTAPAKPSAAAMAIAKARLAKKLG